MTMELCLPVVLAGVTLAAAIDLRTRRIPNVLTTAMAGAGLWAAASGAGGLSLGASVAGLIVGVGLMLPGYLVGATGAGDVKLLGAVGAWVGPAGTVETFVFAAAAGGVIALAVAARRGRLAGTLMRAGRVDACSGTARAREAQAETRVWIAYAPAIAIGAAVALIA